MRDDKIAPMNEEAQKVFDKIVGKELDALTQPDIEFIKSRRDYLSQKQLDYFAPVLSPKKEKVEKMGESDQPKKPNTKK